MRSVNKVILMGNLAAAPEMRSTPTGKNIATFSLATNNEWRNSAGENQRSTDFHRVVVWNGLATQCEKFLKKGSAIYLEGRLHNRSYEGNDKKRHYVTEITAEQINFIRLKKTKDGDMVSLETQDDSDEE
ncbi:MAG: single-strand binding protein, single-strand DNA-binding protein [Candidatus Peregrinibacteria bacterium GW2011_GWE2_39_6]|nr:MAG: single-strand binding protein, single-strand DNA-binding protein [Candidatus Peregrinibacteria bacterium GW2011_GWF2_39_17]KKR23411.1 MAG: single-strand binding protein, single-strand DNA-binding protein [Candidatus Peregrinibacteria bacterium GW2011_GWE2_39_6]HCW32842.1 single-stranded DNA-binding protein [Candidatus Peregrinibacteria bacterium]